jgi:hypothetical protein
MLDELEELISYTTFFKLKKKVPGYFYFRQAYGVITLPLREGKIFCKKILGGG